MLIHEIEKNTNLLRKNLLKKQESKKNQYKSLTFKLREISKSHLSHETTHKRMDIVVLFLQVVVNVAGRKRDLSQKVPL